MKFVHDDLQNDTARKFRLAWKYEYFAHSIRNEKDLACIRKYIDGDPAYWTHDDENPAMRKSSAK